MKNTFANKSAVRPKKGAFIWSRQFSMEQIDKMNRIGVIRSRMMDSMTLEMSRFCSCQPVISRNFTNLGSSAEGMWEGKQVKFRIHVRPLFVEYALAVYKQALLDTHAHYPGFDKHYFEDGPLVGERRIVFPDKLDYAAALWLYWRFDELDKNDAVKVSESFSVSISDLQLPGARIEYNVFVVLDKPVIERETCKEVEKALEAGVQYPINSELKKCSLENYDNDPLVNVSLPELVYLNWELARKPTTPLDMELFTAIDAFDFPRVKKALESGADPNAIIDASISEAPPLVKVVEFKWLDCHPRPKGMSYEEHASRYPGPLPDEIIAMIDLLVSYGAAVDWTGPNEVNALSRACLNADPEVVRHIIELGSDPSIISFDDNSPWGIGTAWDYAFSRCEVMSSDSDERAMNTLRTRWKLPFEDVRIKE